MSLEVPLIVTIGTRAMTLKDIVNLAPGTIIELPKSADDELEILIDNKSIGAGRAVKVGQNYGVRITYVGDLKARVAALDSMTRPAGSAVTPPKPIASSPTPVAAAA